MLSNGEKTLPENVGLRDIKYPSYAVARRKVKVIKTIDMHYVPAMGWLVATVPIGRVSAQQQAAGAVPRTYAMGVDDGAIYSIGLGPNVKRSVKLYLTSENTERLARYRDLHDQGVLFVNQLRDQRATRSINTTARKAGVQLGR